MHIAWGAAGVLILARRRDAQTASRLALTFGVFYTAFGILGVSVHHPLGLELGIFENTFHFTAGPLTLAVGLLAVFLPPAEPIAKLRPATTRPADG